MAENVLQDIAAWRSRAGAKGIPSICSAHPLVIEAARARPEIERPVRWARGSQG